MDVIYFQVDAFANQVFKGNAAGVCLLSSWPSDQVLLFMAAEHHLAETAFVGINQGSIHLRWFTPEIEMDLCGHATLAAAHVLFSEQRAIKWLADHNIRTVGEVVFQSLSGALKVKCGDRHWYTLDFPERTPVQVLDWQNDQEISLAVTALGVTPREVWRSRDLLCLYDDPHHVVAMRPDPVTMARLDLGTGGVIVTAAGAGVDIREFKGESPHFISRFFTPQAELFEDDVTGSAHCTLAPFWGARLNKTRLSAFQASTRSGWLQLRLNDPSDVMGPEEGRVWISGSAITYLEGTIFLTDN